MADVTVFVQITPSSSTPATYSWAYQIGNSGSLASVGCDSQFAQVAANSSDQITIVLVTNGASGDTCVFQGQPLTFYRDYHLTETFTPQWYDAPEGGQSSITFMDHNSNMFRRTYYFKINAMYTTAATSSSENITSPDPTIVNAGTDGQLLFTFGSGEYSSQQQQKPETVTV